MSEYPENNSPSSQTNSSNHLTKQGHQDVLHVVRRYLIEVMELEDDELAIEMATHFQDDLELESIEMIALGDALRAHYLESEPPVVIDFAHWLTQLSIEQLMDLKVDDLVTWIKQEIDSAGG